MNTKWFSKEIRIALVAIVGILLIYFGMNFLKGKAFLTNENLYYARFADVTGLAESNPVFADGYKVGIVKDIVFNFDNGGGAVVELALDKQLRLPKGTAAEIESDFMGNVKLNLLMANDPRNRVEPGDTIMGQQYLGALAKVSAMVPKVEKMLPKLDSILMALNTLVSNPAITHSLANMEVITGNLKTTTGEINTLLAGLNRNVPVMMNKAQKTLDNTQNFTDKLAAIDIDGTMGQVNNTIQNLQAFTEKLNSKEGSLGLLMNDPTLYHNLNATINSADSLLIDFKAHPKRYVHFSVFGRKGN